jgi:hypothetical protein
VIAMEIVKKIFIAAALTGGAGWLLKMVAIPVFDGANTDSNVVATLWAVGMVGYLVAAASGTALLLSTAPLPVRIVAAIAAVPVSFVLLDLLDGAAKSVYTADGWFRDELALVLAAMLLVVLGLRALASTGAEDRRPA